jgi:serine/threonine-protein phosphatase PGAM5
MNDMSRRRPMAALPGLLVLTGAVLALLGAPARAADAPPAGTRTLYLIRHGVYDEDDVRDAEVGKALTPQGREQARLTGARLAQLPTPIDILYASTMTRARQTAEIIGEALGGWQPGLSSDIKECTPPTVREDIMARERPGAPDSCRQILDGAWARFFRPTAGRDSTVALVCHGNVIRYFVARALGLEPTLWLNMTIANCSLTVVQVRPDGRTRLVSFSDAGHLPPALQTFPRPSSGPGARPDSTAKAVSPPGKPFRGSFQHSAADPSK